MYNEMKFKVFDHDKCTVQDCTKLFTDQIDSNSFQTGSFTDTVITNKLAAYAIDSYTSGAKNLIWRVFKIPEFK